MEQRDFLKELSGWRGKVSAFGRAEREMSDGMERLGVDAMRKAGVEEVVFNGEIGDLVWVSHLTTTFCVYNVTIRDNSLYVGCTKNILGGFDGRFVYLREIDKLDERLSVVEGIMRNLGYEVKND